MSYHRRPKLYQRDLREVGGEVCASPQSPREIRPCRSICRRLRLRSPDTPTSDRGLSIVAPYRPACCRRDKKAARPSYPGGRKVSSRFRRRLLVYILLIGVEPFAGLEHTSL